MEKSIKRRDVPAVLPTGLLSLPPLLQRVFAARAVTSVDELIIGEVCGLTILRREPRSRPR